VCEGEGAQVVAGTKVFAHYKGTLLSGKVFDQSYTNPNMKQGLSFTVGQREMIRGWDVGFQGMRVGEKAILTLRADYAYGNSKPTFCFSYEAFKFICGKAKIPAGSTLVFEVELLSINEPPSEERLQRSDYARYKLEQDNRDDIIHWENMPSDQIRAKMWSIVAEFATQNPTEAACYVIGITCSMVAFLAAGWPLAWVCLWKGPFSTLGTLMMPWTWPWSDSGAAATATTATATPTTVAARTPDVYGRCISVIAWRMWMGWLAFLLGGIFIGKVIVFKMNVPQFNEWRFPYSRLSAIYYIFLAISVSANLTLFQRLTLDCPLLAPSTPVAVAAAEAVRAAPEGQGAHTTDDIWFGWTFDFASNVMVYTLITALLPLLALLIHFDKEGKVKSDPE
jgi:FKBP-type peptidyl-prolyl cis-trans isomerase 2